MNLSLAYNMISAKLMILRACKKTNCRVCPLFDKNTAACSVKVEEWTKLPNDEELLNENKYLKHIDWEARWNMRKDYLRRNGFFHEIRRHRHVWARGDEEYDIQYLKDMSDTKFMSLLGESEVEFMNAEILPPSEVTLDRIIPRGFSTIME